MSDEYMLNYMKMSFTVKHKVNLKSYRDRDSLLLHYCNAKAFSNDLLVLNLKWRTSLILQQLTDLDPKVKSKNST